MSSSPHTLLASQYQALEANAGIVADPGDAGTFALRAETPLYCNLTIGAGSETRVLPSAANYALGMEFKVNANQISGGSCQVTGATATKTLATEGDAYTFTCELVNGSNAWVATGATDDLTSMALADDVAATFGTGTDAQILWSTGDASNHTAVFALGASQQLHITDVGAKATDWNVSAGTHPSVFIHSDTTPATDYTVYGPHDGDDAVVFNVVGATGARFLIDGVGALEMDDAAITSFTAATDTAGKSVFIETQDAGGTALAARTGGAFSIKTGDGSANAGAVAAGAGGAASLNGGVGGANTGGASGQVGGAGGAVSLIAGAGGATNSTGAHASGAGGGVTIQSGAAGASSGSSATAAGAGGTVAILAGDGGNGTAGSTPGGNGGTITLTAGTGGSSAGGAAGDPGKVKIVAGLLHFTNGQSIDMADAQVVLTINPGTPTGTTITSNTLFVDANSGATEDLLLPPEADCNGLTLHIANTGGESIVVKEDGDSVTICTISTAESATVFCNGTTWYGGVLKAT